MANVPPPPGLTRAESKELNRQKLLAATREILIECGYGALSARQVSARAGVAQSSFYAHFKDKEDLVQTFADQIFSQLRAQLRATRQTPEAIGWDEMLHQSLLRIYEFFLRERELVALLFQELDQPGSPINDIGQAIFDALHNDFSEDLNQLIRDGRVPPVPVEATVSLIIGATWYVLRRVLAGKLEDPLAMLDDITRMNRAMVRGLAMEESSLVPKP